MGRAPCCDKANVKKGPWSPEEDAKLKSYIEQNGTGGNWIALPQKIGLKRCGKSCRLRWLNYLRPNIKHGGFSEEEDNIICSLYINIGSRWSIIAAQLPGRTDNDIKNYWNTRLKKKLLGNKQRKERKEPPLRQETGHSTPATVNQHIAPYWPEPPCAAAAATLTPIPIPIQAPDSSFIQSDGQDSLRALLIKLGGRFSDTSVNNTMYPEDQTYVNSVSTMLSSNSNNLGDSNYPVNNMFEGYGDLASEMVYGTGYNNGVSSVESSSWGNVNCLEYPQLVSEFENCLHSFPQEHLSYEVSSYFGPQYV